MRAVEHFPWRPELQVERVPSPQRIAPYSLAIEADIIADDVDIGSGRLVILYDPEGNDAWDGTTRCVSYVRSDVEFEMVTDRLLTDVGWSWLTEALALHGADFTAASGTVTTLSSRSYGSISGQVEQAEVEIRASWTALPGPVDTFSSHIAAWQELLCQAAGLEPLPNGVVSLVPRILSGGRR